MYGYLYPNYNAAYQNYGNNNQAGSSWVWIIIVIFIIMVIVLKSIGLPIILILAIEFAIFLNMAFAYFTGTKLPFIASIIVGTIQLGATIDYAILMSTRYLEERIKVKDKKKAIEEALRVTKPNGYLYIAYLTNYYVMLSYGLKKRHLLDKGLFDENYKFYDKPEEIFTTFT